MVIKMIWITFLALSIPLIYGCNFLKSYPQDNFVEEIIEEVIEMELGLKVDITPFSPE